MMINPGHEATKILNRFAPTSLPIDVEGIAKNLGAKIVKENSEDTDHSGLIYATPSGFIIGVNSTQLPTRQRFTIAHEIGHMVMHPHILTGTVHVDRAFAVKLNRDKRSSLGNDLLEIQANQFAAELLMPSDMIKKDIKDLYIDIENDAHVKALADKYEVSVQAMSIKLFETFSSDFSILKG